MYWNVCVPHTYLMFAVHKFWIPVSTLSWNWITHWFITLIFIPYPCWKPSIFICVLILLYLSSLTSSSVVVKYLHGYAAIWKEMEEMHPMMILSVLQLQWMCMTLPWKMREVFLVMVRPVDSFLFDYIWIVLFFN